MTNRADDLVARPEVLKSTTKLFIWIQIESRASPAGDMDRIVFIEVDIRELECGREFVNQRLVGQKALAHQIIFLRRVLKVRVAVRVVNDLAALRTREIDFYTPLGQVP